MAREMISTEVFDLTLPRKASSEAEGARTENRHRVGEERILRRGKTLVKELGRPRTFGKRGAPVACGVPHDASVSWCRVGRARGPQ